MEAGVIKKNEEVAVALKMLNSGQGDRPIKQIISTERARSQNNSEVYNSERKVFEKVL